MPSFLPALPTLLPFLAAALALNLTPGADMTLVLAQSLGRGRPAGIWAAFGVAGVFMLAIVFRCLSWSAIHFAMRETVKVGGMVFFILISSTVFSQLLAYSGASAGMLHWATGFHVSRLVILLIMFIILTLLGMFMDSVSMMLITVPIFFPVIVNLGVDPIWFGIVVVKMCEICLITPPIGLNCFVVNGVRPDIPLSDVFRGIMPFFIADVVTLALFLAFPDIILWLPRTMHMS